ncbi:MAG: porin family protein [candidate division NC10 bacterium]|nr:porin family protein [candidate division NC10 bacterium]
MVCTLGLFATPASPGAEEAGARKDGGAWGFQKGQQEVGLLVGYGFEIDSAGSDKSDMVKNLEFALVRARWGIFLTDRVGQGFLEGNLEFLVEPAFLLSVEPTRRTGYELSVLFRYHFATGSRWVPFVTLGAGIIEENFEVSGRPSAGFNFTPQGGPGVSYLLGGNMAVSLEWRIYHVSNANIDTPNVGLNISFLLLGLSFFF